MNTELSLWGYFVQCVTKKYCSFEGRARRKEFWGNYLFSLLTVIAAGVVGAIFDATVGLVLYYVAALALTLPALGASIRRLHDIGKSGSWYFLIFVPFGAFVLLAWFCMDSQPGDNEFGPNPKEVV